MTANILVVDDDPEMCRLLARRLGADGHQVHAQTSPAEALEQLSQIDADVVITDVRMPKMDGLSLCQRLTEIRPDVPVIVMTAFGSVDAAIEAMRAGAYDFLVKPFEMDAARAAVRRAVERRTLRAQVDRLQRALEGRGPIEGLLGDCPAMVAVFDLVARIADSDASVLITGESGTGKELVARALHEGSRRQRRPWVAVNCAAMPDALLESELFGHVRGAFTDARAERLGLFREAEGGTLFLDEIGELPLALQPKLLRSLQERTVRPVGGQREYPIDVRLVAATNRDLEQCIEDGTFREDLFYRINVVEVALPPLRARGSDILLLAQAFLETYAKRSGRPITGFQPPAAKKLLEYGWPGNIRQLQNCIERAVALCRGPEISVEDLPVGIQAWTAPSLDVTDPADLVPMEEIERRYIERVCEAAGGNKSLAAEILGFNRKTLYRKLKRYGLPRE